MPKLKIQIVFDVRVTSDSRPTLPECFTNSTIYSFEPVGATFGELRQKFRVSTNVLSFKLALGSTHGKRRMVVEGHSEMFFILDESRALPEDYMPRLETVDLESLDRFCAHQKIIHIDFLKIDTEGMDFEVLNGADGMISAQRVDIVEVEAGMNRSNDRHVPFEKLKSFLEDRHYSLFCVYDQVHQ